jgi:pSer/pThr/pTyr-binding forkhead associated (FHA) protein
VVLTVKGAGSDIVLSLREPGTHVLGRAKNAPLRIDNPTVSRQQARIVLSADRSEAALEHGGGVNPTRLNDANVEKRTALASGDVIGFGAITIEVVLKRGGP